MVGRRSCNPTYHEPDPSALHTHPAHRDPEYDDRMEAAARRELWVVTAVSNPVRFKTRYALYKAFKHHITHELRLNLVTVEAAFGDRDHQLTDDGLGDIVLTTTLPNGVRTIDVRVRNSTQLWLKENLWNLGAMHVPTECKYVMFCDADIRFLNNHIGTEIVHALQEYRVVQPFETAADLGPENQVMDVHRSFGWCHANGWDWKPQTDGKGGYYAKKPAGVHPAEAYGNPWHPGYAMAIRRDVLDKLSLLETGILGAGDHHMMAALIGKAALSYPSKIGDAYKRQILAWQTRASDVVRGSLGYVAGTIVHSFHGSKRDRRYVSRWDILIQHAYDADTDVYKNSKGVLELRDSKPELRDAIRRYFKQRNEDALGM